MFSSLISTGATSWVMDLTGGYVPLGVGLLGFMWISAGLVTWMAIEHYWETSHMCIPEHPSYKRVDTPMEYKEAA